MKKYEMLPIKESYELCDRMLADETLTNEDKIDNLTDFILTITIATSGMILSSHERIEVNDLLKTYEDKIIELKEI